jgi:phenylacetate-CoA ligase
MQLPNKNGASGRRESMFASLYSRMVQPLVEPKRYGGFAQRFRLSLEPESWPAERLAGEQFAALSRLLVHAKQTSPFYAERFAAAGFDPERMHCPEELARVPALTRGDLQMSLAGICSSNYRRDQLELSHSGGTTTIPVPILRDYESVRQKHALQARFNSWAGMWPGDRVMYLWGAQSDYAENPSLRWQFFERYVLRATWLQASHLDESVFAEYRRRLNHFRPKILYGYPTPLAMFARYLRDNHLDFHQPQAVICTAEPLAHRRAVIHDVFGVPVFEHYGAREFGMIAAECELHSGLHLNPLSSYVEFVPVDGASREGLHEMYVTDLLNYGMPLIRYRVNDCALLPLESCACGRAYPVIRELAGRTSTLFRLRNGRIVLGVSLSRKLAEVCPKLQRLQVIQHDLDRFTLKYVPSSEFGPGDLNSLRQYLNEFFGIPLEWTFERVSDIPREKSGKTRLCISQGAVDGEHSESASDHHAVGRP